MGKCANETRLAHPMFFTLAVIVGLAPPPHCLRYDNSFYYLILHLL